MREIKFRYRIKDYDSKKPIYFLYIEMVQIENPLIYGEIFWDNFEILSRDEYTGLKDKNGKEIYEGGIIRYNYHLEKGGTDFMGEVIYDIRKFEKSEENSYHVGFILRSTDNIDKSFWYTDLPDLEDVEVIGNIYENPELLKEDK